MTGHIIKLGRGVILTKEGKLKRVPVYRNASQAAAAKESPKQSWGPAK